MESLVCDAFLSCKTKVDGYEERLLNLIPTGMEANSKPWNETQQTTLFLQNVQLHR